MLAMTLMDYVEIQTRVTGELKEKRFLLPSQNSSGRKRRAPIARDDANEAVNVGTPVYTDYWAFKWAGYWWTTRRMWARTAYRPRLRLHWQNAETQPASTGNPLCSHSDSDRTVLCVGVQQDSRSDLKHTNAVCLVKCTFLRAPAPQRAAALQRSD